MLLNVDMQRTQIVVKMAASNPTRRIIITRIRIEGSLQRRKVPIQKGTVAHPVRTPTMTVKMTLTMRVNHRRYSL